MIEASNFVAAARRRGFGVYAGVPCSYLTPLINYVIDSKDVCYVNAANEGDAVAIVAGAELGGVRSIAMFQNSGLGNAVSPLTSLTHIFRIPVLLITTLRGEPDAAPDEPQHQLMGAITTRLLETMQIPWEYFPSEEDEVEGALERALDHMAEKHGPYALVMRRGSVRPSPLRATPGVKPVSNVAIAPAAAVCTRRAMLEAIQAQAGPRDVLIATTGYTGRELYDCSDRANQLYMVGSMGCASSLGLGLSLVRPDHRIIVIDGDGAALMRLGAMSTIGYERPRNLVHILLDNHVYESTGSQSTVSQSVDFCAMAAACGYPKVARLTQPSELAAALADDKHELAFYHVPILPGLEAKLGRPDIGPPDVAGRLRRFLDTGR